jgi:DNA adenine methylase
MLIRYPGSKDKHLKYLDSHLSGAVNRSVVEPFAGTASITFHLLKQNLVDSYWINDLDESIAALWRVVKEDPDWLISEIYKYVPNVSDFYNYKNNPGISDRERAFRKVVLHQVSYSGLGAMAGGPLGGKSQSGEYKIDSRWRPIKLDKLIRDTSALLNSVADTKITSIGWEEVVIQAIEEEKFIYLDPPYYNQGSVLYVSGSLDHRRLAETLENVSNPWILSYDDTPEIRDLYSFANVERLDVTSHLHHKMIGDLIIKPRMSK